MEKVFKLIDKIAIIIKVLCLDGKIKKLVLTILYYPLRI